MLCSSKVFFFWSHFIQFVHDSRRKENNIQYMFVIFILMKNVHKNKKPSKKPFRKTVLHFYLWTCQQSEKKWFFYSLAVFQLLNIILVSYQKEMVFLLGLYNLNFFSDIIWPPLFMNLGPMWILSSFLLWSLWDLCIGDSHFSCSPDPFKSSWLSLSKELWLAASTTNRMCAPFVKLKMGQIMGIQVARWSVRRITAYAQYNVLVVLQC